MPALVTMVVAVIVLHFRERLDHWWESRLEHSSPMPHPPMPGQSPQVIYVERAPKKRSGCLAWLLVILAIPFVVGLIRSASHIDTGSTARPVVPAPSVVPKSEKQQADEVARNARIAEYARQQREHPTPPPVMAPSPASAVTPAPQPEIILPDGVKILKYKWEKGGFGTVLLADVTLKNTNKVAVRDIQLSSVIRGESGLKVASHSYLATIILKPGETRKLSGLNFGFIPQQAEKASIFVSDCSEELEAPHSTK
jgi:hypothetical protein